VALEVKVEVEVEVEKVPMVVLEVVLELAYPQIQHCCTALQLDRGQGLEAL
jgi:hypothetical protein